MTHNDHSGVLLHWRWGDRMALGYLQKWSLPVPGDLVDLEQGASTWPGGCYRVTHRRFQQPESSHPRIEIWVQPERGET